MKPFNRILVPVDFSEHSAKAVRVAADLARRFDGLLTVIHVYDPLVYSLPDGFMFLPQQQIDQLVNALQENLDKSKQLALDAGAPRVEAALLRGPIADEIVERAARGEYSVIVMGTRGRTGMKHLLLGSIAERVVRLAPCPVLTVKAGPASSSPQHE